MENNYILVILLLDIGILLWLTVKYLKSLDKVISSLKSVGEIKIPGLNTSVSKTSLMSNFEFLNALFSREYKAYNAPEFVKSMEEARKYFILQFCFGFTLFLLPIVENI